MEVEQNPVQRQFQSHSVVLGDDLRKRYFVTLENISKNSIKIDVLKFNSNTNKWDPAFTTYFDNCEEVKFINKFWDAVDSNVLLLFCNQNDSPSSLNYLVLGESDDSVITYVYEKNVFQGSIFFRENRLIRGTGNQYSVWTKYNNKFRLIPYNMPAIPGAKVIRYFISSEDTIEINDTIYTVPVGTTVQFIRNDYNNIKERFIFDGNNPCLLFMSMYATFTINCKTLIELSIIPGGNNWENAKNIRINAI